MAKKMTARQRAIRRRNIFLVCVSLALILVIALFIWLVSLLFSGSDDTNKNDSQIQSSSKVDVDSSEDELPAVNNEPKVVQKGNYTLDVEFTNLLLVNEKNPLPSDYDYESGLVSLDGKYRNGQLDKISAQIEPYVKAMCEAAWAENVTLKVWSPYRSYATQKMLFDNRVNGYINQGYSAQEAEKKALTINARPGTSEHHTGLAIDFNCANDSFEGMPAFKWMQEHAHEYGFIMRYPKDKTEITGVIYEPWHWRFVGISEAEKIKDSGLCLEEYLEKNKD